MSAEVTAQSATVVAAVIAATVASANLLYSIVRDSLAARREAEVRRREQLAAAAAALAQAAGHVGEAARDGLAADSNAHSVVREAYSQVCLYARSEDVQVRGRHVVRVSWNVQHSSITGTALPWPTSLPYSKVIRAVVEPFLEAVRTEIGVSGGLLKEDELVRRVKKIEASEEPWVQLGAAPAPTSGA